MSAGWVAGATRAGALLPRALGAEGVRETAEAPTLEDALLRLRTSAYRRDLRAGASLAEAQRSVSMTLLWHLRVLAGWQPRRGADAIRLLAAGFEIANTEERLHDLSAGESDRTEDTGTAAPYRLGTLSTAWPRLAVTRSPAELRSVLATSVWGDPGAHTAAAVATGMRVSAAVRTAATVPEAVFWATGRLALLVAREVFVVGRTPAEAAVRRAARLLGSAALRAVSFDDFRHSLPATAHWVLEGCAEPADLWRAEELWWERLERDGGNLVRRAGWDSAQVVGAVAVLSVDAWRVRGALELAARGGGSLEAVNAPR